MATEIVKASGLEDRIVYLTLTGADDADGTGSLTVQAKDGAGNNLSANVLARVWIGTANDYGADALTGFTSTTGTTKETVTANAELLVISDASGTIVCDVNNGGAGTLYAWAECSGQVFASGAISITA